MRYRLTTIRVMPLLALLAGLAACNDDSPAGPGEEDLLETVRQETARYASTATAIDQGYESDEHCVEHPDLGGMGVHWVNGALIDPVFDPLAPEALLYAPGPGGGLQLVGIEYIVIDAGQNAPAFDGHPFDIGGVPPLMDQGVPHWSLHVWVHEENPSGMFAPFNPNVSCG